MARTFIALPGAHGEDFIIDPDSVTAITRQENRGTPITPITLVYIASRSHCFEIVGMTQHQVTESLGIKIKDGRGE